MRISDWSSDVCSSDLRCQLVDAQQFPRRTQRKNVQVRRRIHDASEPDRQRRPSPRLSIDVPFGALSQRTRIFGRDADGLGDAAQTAGDDRIGPARRSEENTSELQSLMRNSYAGFFLKKKKSSQSTY